MKNKTKKMSVLGHLYMEIILLRKGGEGNVRHVCQVTTSSAPSKRSGTLSVMLHL